MLKLASIARLKKITHQQIADALARPRNNVTRALSGNQNVSLDTFLRLCTAVQVRLELHYDNADTQTQTTRNSNVPRFVMVPDPDAMQLYILHTKTPACLLHIVQTMPAHIELIETYEPVEPETLTTLMADAMEFYRIFAGKDGNYN